MKDQCHSEIFWRRHSDRWFAIEDHLVCIWPTVCKHCVYDPLQRQVSGDRTAGLENVRLEKAAPNCRGGKCETGKRGNVFFYGKPSMSFSVVCRCVAIVPLRHSGLQKSASGRRGCRYVKILRAVESLHSAL